MKKIEYNSVNHPLTMPVYERNSREFSGQILEDLISQGYEGPVLLEKFKEYNNAVRPAVLKMI